VQLPLENPESCDDDRDLNDAGASIMEAFCVFVHELAWRCGLWWTWPDQPLKWWD